MTKSLIIFLALTLSVTAANDKAYEPGAYGKVKDASMFICWREWDGEIRLGGVAKTLSTPFYLGSEKETEDYFCIEIQGPSGSANYEQLMFGHYTRNIVIKDTYKGTIEINGRKYFVKDIIAAMRVDLDCAGK